MPGLVTVMAALLIELVPVESTVPASLRMPPLMIALARSRNEVVSTSTVASMASVTVTFCRSSAPPVVASSLPVPVLATEPEWMVNVPFVTSSRLLVVVAALVMELVPVESTVPALLRLPPLIAVACRSSVEPKLI